MSAVPWMAIAQGASDFTNNMINVVAQNRAQKKQNEANMDLAEYQYSRDLDMWNRANFYNSPGEQMKRLKEAGLNPNLVYGNGVTGNSTASLPHYQAPEISKNFKPFLGPDVGAMLNTYQDIAVRQAQIDNLRAATEGKKIENLWSAFNLPIRKEFAWNNAYNTSKKLEYEKDTQLSQYHLKTGQATVAYEWSRQIADKIASEITGLRLKNEGQTLLNMLNQQKVNWGKLGLTTSDKLPYRFIVRLLNSLGFTNYEQIWNKF